MKKLLASLLAGTMALTALGGLAACGGGDGNNGPELKVWAPNESINGYKAIISQFKAKYPDYAKYNITFEAKAESTVQTALGKDPSTGADVFFIPSDHLYKLYNRSVLQALPDSYANTVKGRDEQFTYEFATINDKIMAFPATNDNGYFLYYDSTFFTNAEDLKSLDTIQAKAKEASKHVAFDYGDAYYVASFFIGTGCTFDYADATMKKYDTTLDSPQGEAAITAYWNYFSAAKNGVAASDAQVIVNADPVTGFKEGNYVAAVAGTWKWSEIKRQVPGAENKIKTAVLPSFTDGTDTYDMGSFYGAKYCAVNALKSPDSIRASLALAEFLTSEEGQLARYNATNAGPSNKKLNAENETIKNDSILATYKAQVAKKGYVQHDQADGFWADTGILNPVKKIATGVTTTLSDAISELKSVAASIKIDKT